MNHRELHLIIVILLFYMISCKNKPNVVYQDNGRIIIQEIFNEEGRLLEKNTLNVDSFKIKSSTHYYTNGNLKKWLWYDKPNDYPLFGIYFDSLGNYVKFGGLPFIGAHKTKDEYTALEIVNPPVLKTVVGYKDFYKDKLIFKQAYEPEKTDSTQWITLENYHYDSSHIYYAYFYLVDDSNKIIMEDSIELVP